MYVYVLICLVLFHYRIYSIQNCVPDVFGSEKNVHTLSVHSSTCRTIAW